MPIIGDPLAPATIPNEKHEVLLLSYSAYLRV
jgi:hypothetical protein